MTSIEGFENYLIFEDGVIINMDTGREMKTHRDQGYYKISLSKNATQKTLLLHRLIALAYIPNPDNKPCIDHINRDRGDNRLENLRWATCSENDMNRTCYSNSNFQFISKQIEPRMKQGFRYKFTMNRPSLKHTYSNGDLELVKEYRNKFCNDNDIEFNDA